MKVYIVQERCRQGEYGIATYVNQFCKIAENRDFQVVVLHLYYDDLQKCTWEEEEILHINIQCTENSHRLYCEKIARVISSTLSNRQRPIVFFNNFDVVLLESLKKINALCVNVVHWLNSKTIVNGNIALMREVICNYSSYANAEILRESISKEALFLHKVDAIVALNRSTKKLIEDIYNINPSKIVVIENAIDNDEILFKKRIRNSIPTFLFVGRKAKIKGFNELVAAFEIVKEKIDFNLVIVGSGDININCSSKLGSHIIDKGWLPQNKIRELYTIADFGVLPSYGEECSYVGIEMMKFAIPVICSDASGLAEMFTHNKEALICKISHKSIEEYYIEPKKLADSILEMESLSKDYNIYNNFRHNALCTYMNRYNINRFKHKMCNFLYGII